MSSISSRPSPTRLTSSPPPTLPSLTLSRDNRTLVLARIVATPRLQPVEVDAIAALVVALLKGAPITIIASHLWFVSFVVTLDTLPSLVVARLSLSLMLTLLSLLAIHLSAITILRRPITGLWTPELLIMLLMI